MSAAPDAFFGHTDRFFYYRSRIYELSDQTLKTNRTDLRLFKDFIAAGDYDAIDGPAVIDFQYYLKNDRQNCGASINRKIFTLRSYANFLKLYDQPLAKDLPFYDVLKVRSGYRSRPRALTHGQIKTFFAAIDTGTVLGIRDYAVYALMYQLGLRVGEVHELNLDAIDLQGRTILVTGKGRKLRSLHLNHELVETIAHYLAVRPLFCNSNRTRALFVSKKGNRLAIRTMEDNLKKVLLRADLHAQFNVSCHTLRHSLASHLNDKQVDVLVIQSILGHSSTRSTEPYIHPSHERVQAALESLPTVVYVKELINKGVLKLRFQNPYRPKRE